MAYKLGLLLSMVLVMSVMLLGGDIICVSSIHSSLDALSLVVSRSIGREGAISDALKETIASHGADFTYDGPKVPCVGERIDFSLSKEYQSFVLSKETMKITVKRTAIVGYYMNEKGGVA